jgi:alpha-beta hydrolase superfamily lysophospholipase
MSESIPQWPAEAVWPPHRLTDAEAAIEPRPWFFRASDGYPLAVLTWPSQGSPVARLVILHGVQSHAGWYHGLGRRLAAAGYEAHFPDRRGSGANTRERGHAPSARRLRGDLNELLAHVRQAAEPASAPVPLVVAGISWGGKLAVLASAERRVQVDGLALLCPGLHPRVGVTRRQKLGVAVALLTGQAARRTLPIPLADPALFTANAEAQRFIADDPLSLRVATAGLMFASRVIDRGVARAPARITQPAVLLLAEHDRIVDNSRTTAYFERIASNRTTLIVCEGAHHTPEFDADPTFYTRRFLDWLATLSNRS